MWSGEIRSGLIFEIFKWKLKLRWCPEKSWETNRGRPAFQNIDLFVFILVMFCPKEKKNGQDKLTRNLFLKVGFGFHVSCVKCLMDQHFFVIVVVAGFSEGTAITFLPNNQSKLLALCRCETKGNCQQQQPCRDINKINIRASSEYLVAVNLLGDKSFPYHSIANNCTIWDLHLNTGPADSTAVLFGFFA